MTSASQILLGLEPRRPNIAGASSAGDEIDMLRGLKARNLAETTGPGRAEQFMPDSALSMQARDLLKKAGVEIRDDMTYDEMKKSFPFLQMVQKRNMAWLSTNADLKKAQLAAWAKAKGDMRLKPAQMESLMAANQAIDEMESILSEKIEQSYDTGPVQNALESVLNFIGAGDFAGLSEKNAFRGALVNVAAQYRKAISGANVSQYEIRLLNQFQPRMSDQDQTFIEKGKKFIEVMRGIRDVRLNSYSMQGKDITPFERAPSEQSKFYKIPKSDTAAIERLGRLGMKQGSDFEVY